MKEKIKDLVDVYSESLYWIYASEEQRKELLDNGEVPPTSKPITEEMMVDAILKVVEGKE